MASSGKPSAPPLAERYSMVTFCPSTKPSAPKPLPNSASQCRRLSSAGPRNPITGIAGCCPRAASGHTATLPRAATNSRRPMVTGIMPLSVRGLPSEWNNTTGEHAVVTQEGPREAAALRDFDPAYVSSRVFRDEGGKGTWPSSDATERT